MPRVSVCIPSYNLAGFIGETIKSVLAQTFTDFELLIEDDGSTDNSLEVIRAFDDPRIVFTECAHEGHNERTNSMVRRASGEYIALLPADDVWAADKLEKQVAYLDAHPDCGIAFSRAEFIGTAGNELLGDPRLFEPPNMARAFWTKRFMVGNCLFIATSLYRRSLHEEVGYFDESLHLLSDLEFYVRVVKNHELHVFEDRFAKIRFRDGANLSAPNPVSSERQADEMALIRDKYCGVKKVKQKKFFIATPFYELKGFSPYIKSLVDSLVGLATYAKESGIEFEFHHVSGDSYVWRARNTLAAMFLKSDCSHLIFIDSDESWEPEGLYRLIKADAPMVGAAYPVKNNWENFGVTIDTEGENFVPKVRADGLIHASKVPTGFMKIAREVFERIKMNEPENWYWEPDEFGTNSKRHNFFGHILEDHIIYGEDISFNKRWQACGGELFIEPRMTIGHFGIKEWKGNYDNYLRSQPGGDLDPARKAA